MIIMANWKYTNWIKWCIPPNTPWKNSLECSQEAWLQINEIIENSEMVSVMPKRTINL